MQRCARAGGGGLRVRNAHDLDDDIYYYNNEYYNVGKLYILDFVFSLFVLYIPS